MALVTDGTAEKASVSPESHIDGKADAPVQPDSAIVQDSADESTVSEDDSVVFGETASSGNSERAEAGSDADPVSDADAAEAAVPAGADAAESDPHIDRDRSSSEDAADIEDPGSENNSSRVGLDRSEEVPSLLGRNVISDNEEVGIVTDQVAADEDAVPEDGVIAEAGADQSASAPGLFHDQTPLPTTGVELKQILESVQDSLAKTQYISFKIDAVSNDTAGLIERVNCISLNHELLTSEIESISSGSTVKNVLSKTFLFISSVVLASLVIIQIYMFISLNKIQRQQNSAGSSVLEHISSLNKKMADYDKNLTKALEKPAQQEHTQSNPAEAEKSDLKTHENNNISSAHATPVHERLNKLRNGLPEKKLIRKETGDWFVYNKKNNECISDVEVIQALNEAYRTIGRSIPTSIPLPPINALCILKPDGKGGTQIVMTEKFVP